MRMLTSLVMLVVVGSALLPAQTAQAAAVYGDYSFRVAGTFHGEEGRERVRNGGTLTIARNRVWGVANQTNETIQFNLTPNRAIKNRAAVQRRRLNGTFIMREHGETTRGVGQINAIITRVGGTVQITGTYEIEWTRGRHAGAVSQGRFNGSKL